MIIPTVGRVVWFWPNAKEPGYVTGGLQPLIGLIAHVHNDRLVNLAVFDANGTPLKSPVTSCKLLQEDDLKPDVGSFCSWMPYQKGQAAKTEALEAKVGT